MYLQSHGAQPLEETSLLSDGEIRRIKAWTNPADEALWARLQQRATTLAALPEESKQKHLTLYRKCFENLRLAKACLQKGHHSFCESFSMYWRLVHQVEQDMVLLMPHDSLLSQCEVILETFAHDIKDDELRRRWLGDGKQAGLLEQIHSELHRISKYSISTSYAADATAAPGGATSNRRRGFRQWLSWGTPKRLRSAARDRERRCLLHTALKLVHDSQDEKFRQESFNTIICVWSAVALFATATLIAVLFFSPLFPSIRNQVSNGSPHTLTLGRFLAIFLLGGAGAHASNLLKSEPFRLTQGPVRRFYLKYLIATPMLSSFAAFFVYLLFSSHLLISITDEATGASTGASLQLVVPEEKDVLFAYATLAVFAGFAADKLVRNLMDRVSTRISQAADRRPPSQESGALIRPHGRASEFHSRTALDSESSHAH